MNEQQYSPTNFKILTPVVKNLIIINVLFYLAKVSFNTAFGIDLTQILGLHYVKSEYFKPYQFVTHLFMHGNFGHLFFNMFALWMFGNILENVLGSQKFLLFYFVTGLGAAFLHSLVTVYDVVQLKAAANAFYLSPTPESFINFLNSHFPYALNNININDFIKQWTLNPYNISNIEEAIKFIQEGVTTMINVPTVGASGAIFGLLLGFGMLFPNSYIYLYFFFPIKAKWFVLLYGVTEFMLGFSARPGDNVAHFAHLGGMIFGFFMIKYWMRNKNKDIDYY